MVTVFPVTTLILAGYPRAIYVCFCPAAHRGGQYIFSKRSDVSNFRCVCRATSSSHFISWFVAANVSKLICIGALRAYLPHRTGAAFCGALFCCNGCFVSTYISALTILTTWLLLPPLCAAAIPINRKSRLLPALILRISSLARRCQSYWRRRRWNLVALRVTTWFERPPALRRPSPTGPT